MSAGVAEIAARLREISERLASGEPADEEVAALAEEAAELVQRGAGEVEGRLGELEDEREG